MVGWRLWRTPREFGAWMLVAVFLTIILPTLWLRIAVFVVGVGLWLALLRIGERK